MKSDFYQRCSAPLAFYVWTDSLILNAVKIKLTYFLNDRADLFVLKLPRISRNLIIQLKKQGMFQNILWIKPPFEDIPLIKRKMLKTCFVHRYKMCYFAQLQQLSKCYRLLFTGALWSETIMLFQYLQQYNPLLKIYIMEEGTANYFGIRAITRCDPLSVWRDKIIRNTRYIGIYKKAVEAIIGMFLTCPEGCLDKDREKIFPISRSDSPEFRQLLSNCIAELSIEEYRSRQVIFFLQPECESEWKNTLRLIQIAIYSVGAKNIIIRPHPDSENIIWKLKTVLPSDVYLEMVQFPFEFVLYPMTWQNRILISRGSSCLFYPRYILGEEPRVIFTNRLYNRGKKNKDKISLLVDRLAQIYKTPERVCSPETIDDFNKFLKGN